MIQKQVMANVLLVTIVLLCSAEKVQILSPERPNIVYANPSYIKYVNVTSRRQGRTNPIYYVSLHLNAAVYFGNNISASFYLYEYRSGKYVRTFIDLHFKLCDLVHKDKLIGKQIKQGRLAQPCPYPPGEYHLSNMTFQQEFIPPGFSKTKSRVWGNFTITSTTELVAAGYMDLEVREIETKRRKKQK